MDIVLRHFNLIEAIFWLGGSGAFLVRAAFCTNRRSLSLTVAVTLCAFGVSDLLEMRTGAWWRPWWLLVLKGACMTTLGITLWRYWHQGQREGNLQR